MKKLFILSTLLLVICLSIPAIATAQFSALTIFGGNNQTGGTGETLTDSLVVLTLVEGMLVEFSVIELPEGSTASLSTTSVRTGSDKIASTELTLGNKPGTYKVKALPHRVDNDAPIEASAVTFTATAEAGTVEFTKFEGEGHDYTGAVGETLNRFIAQLETGGEAYQGATVNFSISETPSGSTGASLSTTSETTNPKGRASTVLTLGNKPGTYKVTASVTIEGTEYTVVFSATAVGSTVLTKFHGDNPTADPGTHLPPFIVRVTHGDDGVSGQTVSFSISQIPSGSTGSSLTKSTNTTNDGGYAHTNLILGNKPGTYKVRASITVSDVTKTVTFTATASGEVVDPTPVNPTPVDPDTGDPDTGEPDTGDPDTGDPITPVQPPSTPTDPNDPIIKDDGGPQSIVFSEIMFVSRGGLHSLPQWIEVRSTARTRLNLRGWTLTLERRADNPILIDPNVVKVTVTFQEDFIIPPKYPRLMTTYGGRNSGLSTHQSEHIYSLISHHPTELDHNRNRNAILDPDGFRLTLADASGEVIDVIGNLEDGVTQWEFPDCNVGGVRSSMMRLFRDSIPSDDTRKERVPRDGTVKESWIRASDAKNITPGIYYGRETDKGTPGLIGGRNGEREVLPVSLSSFLPQKTDIGVLIKWTTESEVDNAGFNILRSQSKEGPFTKLNPSLIQGAGTTGERNEYTWTDTTAKPNTVYYYRIEDISHAGVREQLATVRLRGYVSASGKFTTRWADLKAHN